MLKTYKFYFFFLNFLSIMITLFSEKILFLMLGLELKMFSIIPLINKNKVFGFSSKKVYFVFQSLGSMFFYFGMLLLKQKLILMGMFNKIAGFPLMWFSFFLSSQNKMILMVWICFIQKVPLYFIMKECLILKNFILKNFLLFYLVLTSFSIMFSQNLIFLLAWKKILHSVMNILLINKLVINFFLILVLIYGVLLGLLMFLVISKNKIFSLSKFYLNSKLSYLLFFSLGGIPLFMKMISEFILFKMLKLKIFLLVIVFSLIIQGVAFMMLFLNYYKMKSFNNFLLNKSFIYFFLSMMFSFMYFIYGTF